MIFLTGFPGFIGRRLLANMLATGRYRGAFLLVQRKFEDLAHKCLADICRDIPEVEGGCHIVAGDITEPNLGMTDETYERVCAEANVVVHLAAVYALDVPLDIARAVNVDGTRHVIELCQKLWKIERFVYFSTYAVAGKTRGRFFEDDLSTKEFNNHYESTKFEAEALVRQYLDEIPTVILRPAIVVGDSKSGGTDKFDGPYFVLRVVWKIAQHPDVFTKVRIPSPVSGRAPLNIVPVDYIVKAATELAHSPKAVGKTFHLTDPAPWTVREIIDSAATGMGLPPTLGYVPTPLTRALFRSRIVRQFFELPRELIDYTTRQVVHDDRNAREVLGSLGIVPPALGSYLPTMVQYVAENPETGSDAKF